MIERIVLGGQTGADRAALDAALRLAFPCGGWCPLGRLAEDGPLPPRYPLRETPTRDYAERTRWNVRDSDGTLILCPGEPQGGSALTIVYAKIEGRPWLQVDPLDPNATPGPILAWVREHDLRVVNVVGPRESSVPGIHARAMALMEAVLMHNRSPGDETRLA